ncbi:MAG: S-layer homology domain-containing protein [Oscillospiraceae bacterium]|nr:S-layer homology domain-containing protein [Oscillospiraceae bacterium]
MTKLFKPALALALTLAVLPFPTACAAQFTDTASHWAAEQIEQLCQNGALFTGYEDGSFRPDASITRGEMAVVLNRIFDYQETAENTFSDISGDDWYADAILRLRAAGVLLGDGEFAKPREGISREEAATLMARAFGFAEAPGLPAFDDAAQIAPWACGYVSALQRRSIVSGSGGNFRPRDLLTRAEAVTLLHSLITYRDTQAEAAQRPGEFLYFGEWLPVAQGVAKSPYDNTLFHYGSDGRMRYGDGSVPYWIGVDVSSWQGEIDWNAVAADGIDFAMLRLGYRGYIVGNLNTDAYFEANLQGAAAAGLDVGVYYFSQAITAEEAREEAQYLLAQLNGTQLTYPVVFDWELVSDKRGRANRLDTDTLVACANAFCDDIRTAGYTPMIYFNLYTAYERYDLSRLDCQDFWSAEYRQTPLFHYEAKMWQYTDSGRVKGIDGGVDMNISFVDYGAQMQDPSIEDTHSDIPPSTEDAEVFPVDIIY